MLIPRRFPHVLPEEQALLAAPEQVPAEQVTRLETAIAKLTGSNAAVCLNSGRQGMLLILRHLGVGAGDEVIIPAFTLGALVPLVESLGAKPVPADIDAETLNVTAATVAGRINDKTRAVIVLHAFGAPAPVDEILVHTRARGIPIVEDCAHSLGATLKGRQTGTFGEAGFYSFEITKPVNTYGGGMVVSDDIDLVDSIRREIAPLKPDYAALAGKVKAARLERFLMRSNLGWPILYALAHPWTRQPLSALYRSRQSVPSSAAAYTPAQARLGLKKLESLESRIAWRTRLAGLYRALLAPEIRLQRIGDGCTSTWYFLVATLPVPAEPVRLALLGRGIDSAIGEEVADDISGPLGYTDCPVATHVQSHAIALPLFDSMPEASVRRVCAAVNTVVRRG